MPLLQVSRIKIGVKLLSSNLRGILLPFTTPFTGEGQLDIPALQSNIGKWNETGINGYVVLGSTGERVHLSEREYIKLVEAARARVSSEMVFIVGVGQQSTQATIDEAARVAAAG